MTENERQSPNTHVDAIMQISRSYESILPEAEPSQKQTDDSIGLPDKMV